MVAFFVENGGKSQNLPGAIGNAKAASLAAIFNDNDLSLPFFARTVFIFWIYLIFLSFLHRFNTSLLHNQIYARRPAGWILFA
jgi:hypothetical protein